jgi:methionyl-tRNA formyltransferase
MAFKIVFMGTPNFSVPALKKIHDSEIEIVLVYSQPPKKSNRGMKIEKSSIQKFAEEHALNVRTPNKLQDDLNYFKSISFDLVIVVAYGQIISKEFLQLSKYGFLNIHASILPKWRGAAPIQRSIMAQDSFTGVSIMQIEEKLDSGPVLIKEKIMLDANSTAGEVEKNLSDIGANKILDAIHLVETGKANYVDQDDKEATYAKKIKKEDEKINWQESAKKIIAQINGLNPRPGAYFEYKGEKIKVWKANYSSESSGTPGVVMNDQLTISCGEGSILIQEIQRPGKRAQKTKEFLLGFSIPIEERVN